MNETLKKLRTLLPCEKFVITGSTALCKYGLMNSIGDIDIILVNPTEEAINVVNKLQIDFPASKIPSPDAKTLLGIFMWDIYKIDVFQSKNEPSIHIDDFDYSLIPNIVKAKQSYNRLKDWVQLRSISRIFSKEENFINFINNIN